MLRPDITLGKIEYSFKVVHPEIRDWEGRYFERRYLILMYEGWNFNSGNYLFTTDTK